MNRATLTSTAQIATSVGRLSGYSFAVLHLGDGDASAGLLLVVGYLPFLAFVDVLVQSYSRARHLHDLGMPAAIASGRRLSAVILLTIVLPTLGLGISQPHGWAAAALIAIYLLASLSYLWERWAAEGMRPLALCVLELTIIAAGLLSYWLSGTRTNALLLCLLSFPLGRLLVLTGAGPAEETAPGGTKPASVGRYVCYSLVQQAVGAMSVSLPAAYAQWTGDSSGLARNLVLFRVVHSASAIASLVINSIGSRLFYGTAGQGFVTFGRRYLAWAPQLGMAAMAAALAAGGVAYFGTPSITVVCVLLVVALAFTNFESSLLMNRGLPGLALVCQSVVLAMSIGLMLFLSHHALAFLATTALTVLLYAAFSRQVFSTHLHHINQRTS